MNNLSAVLGNPALLTAIVGAVVSLIVQGVKKLTGTNPTTWVSRGIVAALAIIGTIVMQSTGHSLVDPGLWTGIVQAAIVYGAAHLTHQSVLFDPNAAIPAAPATPSTPATPAA
jgi:hypothetical protein